MSQAKRIRVAVLLNNAAGNIVCRDGRTLSETLAAAFTRHGITARLDFLSGTELKAGAKRALRQAENNQIDALVVGGGDGSIASVASVFAGSDVPDRYLAARHA